MIFWGSKFGEVVKANVSPGFNPRVNVKRGLSLPFLYSVPRVSGLPLSAKTKILLYFALI